MTSAGNQFDAAIIGGGVIGCAIAWRLAQAGLHVVVVERNEIGREASWAAGGMLAPLAEANQPDAFFDLAVASRAMYAQLAQELHALTDIDIEYRTEGTLYLALSDNDEEDLDKRWQWQHQAGLNVKKLLPDCVLKLEPLLNPQLRWALKFPEDHQVDNRRLMVALGTAACKAGVEFREQTEAREVLLANSQVIGLVTTQAEIKTKTVIVAAGSWSSLLRTNNDVALANFNIEPIRGQMMALGMPAPALRHVIYSSHGYLVPRLSGYLIAGSTTEKAGFEKCVTVEGIARIIDRTVKIAPALSKQSIIETWSGLRPKANDDWPVLGNDDGISGLVYATGHYRNGILLTPITAKAISELVLHGESQTRLQDFSPLRFAPAHKTTLSAS